MNFFIIANLITLFVLQIVLIVMVWNKSRIDHTIQVQSSSGDSEVMIINHQIVSGESEESRASKILDAFELIQDRRDLNHEKWLKIKADAIAENEKKDPKDLKLRSVTEGSSTT